MRLPGHRRQPAGMPAGGVVDGRASQLVGLKVINGQGATASGPYTLETQPQPLIVTAECVCA